jgi:hypothetical protein
MCAATGTHRGPEHLFDLDPPHGVSPTWKKALAPVPHPGLRDHLRHLCRTPDEARCCGALYVGTKDPAGGNLPGPVLAAWQIGEGQAWSAVIRL